MKRIGYNSLAYAVVFTVIAVAALASVAGAVTPIVNGALINPRVFNDCSTSTLTLFNSYPAVISITDAFVNCSTGYANRHNWRASADGGLTEAVFMNDASFRLGSFVQLTGTNRGEMGLNLSPWWSQEVDGVFMINNTGVHEVACFGGRLPFFSFTANFGVTYTPGSQVYEEMTYSPNGLSSTNPGTIDYVYRDGTGTYDSGPLPFDMGNPLDPPHGFWGILDDARLGGYFQVLVSPFIPDNTLTATWQEIRYTPLVATPAAKTTWGKLKALYR